MNTASCMKNITVGCRNPFFSLCLYHGPWMQCWANHTHPAF